MEIQDTQTREQVAEPSKVSDGERQQLMARQVSNMVAQGFRVESQSGQQAVVVKGKPCNHVLHLILTCITLTFWAPVWIAMAVIGREKRGIIEVDPFGNVNVQQV